VTTPSTLSTASSGSFPAIATHGLHPQGCARALSTLEFARLDLSTVSERVRQAYADVDKTSPHNILIRIAEELLRDERDLRSRLASLQQSEALAAKRASPMLDTPTSRLWLLPMDQFMQKSERVRSGFESDKGMNFTTDGCSDRGIATTATFREACRRHDFGYRNWSAIFDDKRHAKDAIDGQFYDDATKACAKQYGGLLATAKRTKCFARAGLAYAGLQHRFIRPFAQPNVHETQDIDGYKPARRP
jgi:hypothetical protein